MGLSKPIITTQTDISGITSVLSEIKGLATTAAEKSTAAADDASSAATFAEAAATDAATAATKATSANTNAANVANRLTSTRAGYLDKLSAGVGGINSVQRGKVAADTSNKSYKIESYKINNDAANAFYIDITISEVDTTKTVITCETYGEKNYIARLLNSTTIRVYFYSTGSTTSANMAIYYAFVWQVVEYK